MFAVLTIMILWMRMIAHMRPLFCLLTWILTWKRGEGMSYFNCWFTNEIPAIALQFSIDLGIRFIFLKIIMRQDTGGCFCWDVNNFNDAVIYQNSWLFSVFLKRIWDMNNFNVMFYWVSVHSADGNLGINVSISYIRAIWETNFFSGNWLIKTCESSSHTPLQWTLPIIFFLPVIRHEPTFNKVALEILIFNLISLLWRIHSSFDDILCLRFLKWTSIRSTKLAFHSYWIMISNFLYSLTQCF